MEDQYGMPDLRHYIASRPLFPPPPDLLSAHRPALPYDMLIFRSDPTTSAPSNAGASSSAAAAGCLFESGGGGGGDGGTGRWPRQETLTLLEIRSRLDPKFKEANQKGPLWDEVSRIMSEEHGYQRSGKKCREKFENLYKYYKKTKEGKAGRQDGKHYRFFRQLEALYGEPINKNQSETRNFHIPGETSLSLSNYSEAETSSSDDASECDEDEGKMKKKLGWKVKIKDFIDLQMKKLMDKQEAWMEKMMRTIEDKERERMTREEEWRKQDAERVEREHKFWASERAWIEARDAALMEALQKLTGKESSENEIWPECEINRLVQLRTAMEGKFLERRVTEEVLWEEIAKKMACFGHERSGITCREKWDSVNNYLLKCNKKRKEDAKSCTYFEPISNQGGSVYDTGERGPDDHNIIRSPAANAMTENCFRYFMGDGYGRIME